VENQRVRNGAMHMKRNSQQVASVDTNNYIEGIYQFVRQSMGAGFEPYIATFLFRSLPRGGPYRCDPAREPRRWKL
jgi:hypothetical protein